MKNALIVTAGFCLSFALQAADKPKAPEWTKEQRESMAKVHEQMAACLRSDKTIEVCHDEMMQACKDTNACPMMMKGHHHKDKPKGN